MGISTQDRRRFEYKNYRRLLNESDFHLKKDTKIYSFINGYNYVLYIWFINKETDEIGIEIQVDEFGYKIRHIGYRWMNYTDNFILELQKVRKQYLNKYRLSNHYKEWLKEF